MDFETVSPQEFGASLRGVGLNLLVTDIADTVDFLVSVLDMSAYRVSKDFAIMTSGDQIIQLHQDATYASHPIYDFLPENPPRGLGVIVHLFDVDPDQAAEKAASFGAHILQAPMEKPHGLRECYIMCKDGYTWAASRPIQNENP